MKLLTSPGTYDPICTRKNNLILCGIGTYIAAMIRYLYIFKHKYTLF